MLEKRHALNRIIGSLAHLHVKLGNITQSLEKEVFQVGQFLQLYLQLDCTIQAIRRTVGKLSLMWSMYTKTCSH